MLRSKSRKLNKDLSKSKVNSITKRTSGNSGFMIQKPHTFESSVSQCSTSSHANTATNIIKNNKKLKTKDDIIPLTVNPDHLKINLSTRKKIFPIISDSSMETVQNSHQQYENNRPKTASISKRKKHIPGSDATFTKENNDKYYNKSIMSEEIDANNCFQIIKEAIEDVIHSSLTKILSTQLPILYQKIDEIYTYMRKNEEDLANCFKELESKITHYGEDQARHIRYLCMKLEFDKMLQNHNIGNSDISTLANNRSCQTNNVLNNCNLCSTQRSQIIPKNNCSCCLENKQRASINNLQTQDTIHCNNSMATSLRNINNYDQNLDMQVRCEDISTSESHKRNVIHNNHHCGDGHQQLNLNTKSVLSILEELKKRNSSDMKTSSLLKTNITQNNNSDEYNVYNPNLCSENTVDVGLKDILATIQKYYPIVEKNLSDNRNDVEFISEHDAPTQPSYEE